MEMERKDAYSQGVLDCVSLLTNQLLIGKDMSPEAIKRALKYVKRRAEGWRYEEVLVWRLDIFEDRGRLEERALPQQ